MQIIKKYNNYLLAIFLVTSSYLIAKLFLLSSFSVGLGDFGVYYYVPKAVLDLVRPEHPYTNYIPIYPYFFPPASIPLFKLLLVFPFYLAKYLWTLLNLSLVILSLKIVYKYFKAKIDWTFYLLLSLSLLFQPTQFTVEDGQFNIVMLFIYTLAFWGMKNRKNMLTGIALGFGTITKVSPALMVLYSFYKKKFKIVAIAVVVILALSGLAEIYVSKGINFYYARYVVDDVSKQSLGIGGRDQSILAVTKKFNFEVDNVEIAGKQITKNHVRSLVSYSIVGMLLSLYLILDFKDKRQSSQHVDYAILMIIGVVGTGLTWYHQYTMLLLCFYILFFIAKNQKTQKEKYITYSILIFSFSIMFLSHTKYNIGENLLFGEYNLITGALIMLLYLYYLKGKQNTPNKSNVGEFIQTKTVSIWGLIPLSIFFVFVIQPNPVEYLKQGRDVARIKAINYMTRSIESNKPDLEKGSSDSISKTQRLDEGFVLFKKGEDNKVRKQLSILLLDPINNSNYNFKYRSDGDNAFTLSAKLESKLYINLYGEKYTAGCESNYTTCYYPAEYSY